MSIGVLLFHHFQQSSELVESEVCPTSLFVTGASRALKETSPRRQKIILKDLAVQIGCDRKDLYFLVEENNSDSEIEFPNFNDSLLA